MQTTAEKKQGSRRAAGYLIPGTALAIAATVSLIYLGAILMLNGKLPEDASSAVPRPEAPSLPAERAGEGKPVRGSPAGRCSRCCSQRPRWCFRTERALRRSSRVMPSPQRRAAFSAECCA